MALTKEDLEALGSLIDSKISAAAPPRENHGMVAPENDTAAAPEYYVHLANGEVLRSTDAGSTHTTGADGTTQLVIGRYPVQADEVDQ